mgnify:CR=1 FL=1
MRCDRISIIERLEARIVELHKKSRDDRDVHFDGTCCDACKSYIEASHFGGTWKATVTRRNDGGAFRILLTDPHDRPKRLLLVGLPMAHQR